MYKAVLILIILILAVVLLVYLIYKDLKDILSHPHENRKRYIRITMCSVTTLCLLSFLLHFPALSLLKELFPNLYQTSAADWVQIWLAILSLVVSSVIAILAIALTLKQKEKENFQLYSSLEFTPISNSLKVKLLTELQKIKKYENIFENPFENNIYILSFSLIDFLNPEIEYELTRFTIRAKGDSNNNDDFLDECYAEEETFVNNKSSKKQLVFENYIYCEEKDTKTNINIILSKTHPNGENFEDHLLTIMTPNIHHVNKQRSKYEIELIFNLKSSEYYKFFDNKTYIITMLIENKKIENKNDEYQFQITKTNSKITSITK